MSAELDIVKAVVAVEPELEVLLEAVFKAARAYADAKWADAKVAAAATPVS